MSGSGQEFPSDIQKGSVAPHECPGVVETPFRMSGSGRDTLPDVWEWSGDPPGYLGVVGRPAGCPGVVERLSRMSGSGLETLVYVRKWWKPLPDVQKACRMSGSGL